MIKIIPLAIPVFFALIGVELLVARAQGRTDYLRFSDAITALSCGIGNQVIKVFSAGFLILAYLGVYWLCQPLHAYLPWGPNGAIAWILAILIVDHQYYWWHRHSHRVNFMWAAHIVHHHSQEYNLAVALRQALFTSFTSWPYYLPLAVLGVDPVVFGLAAAINTLYQFWIHTRTVGRLGPLEWVLNTPSHHRVHHGINPEYIDRNHAGMLIVWDRLYGTFVKEEQEPVYGTVMPLESYDPLWANLHYWVYMANVAWHTPRLRDKLWIWFAPPEWSPEGIKEIPPVSAETFEKWDVPLAPGLVTYILGQFLLVTAGTVWILWMEDTAAWSWLALLGVSIVWATWSWGQLFHRRRAGLISEAVRLVAMPLAVGILLLGSPYQLVVGGTVGLFSLASVVWMLMHQRRWTRRDPVPAPQPAATAAAPAK